MFARKGEANTAWLSGCSAFRLNIQKCCTRAKNAPRDRLWAAVDRYVSGEGATYYRCSLLTTHVLPIVFEFFLCNEPHRGSIPGGEDCTGSAAPAWFGGLHWLRSASAVWRSALAPQRQRGLEDCTGSAAPAWFGGLQWLRSASMVWSDNGRMDS